ncbi:flagellar basal-body MS-ring/collar protein FliF [Roseobacteraceae bacterium S113]
MQQLVGTWTALSVQKQIAVLVAAIAMFGAVLLMARVATQPSMSLLYSGLESGPAGDVVSSLEQRGVAYDVRGGAIFVPTAERDQLRLMLASDGLPANGSQGYELLDSLTGFGTTSQMFDAAYWRAKEGELARTILASPQIQSARVHIANATSNPFQRDIRPSASVSVTTNAGTITPAQARAVKFLIASAVAGLDPKDVAVIDGNGGLVASSDDAAPVTAGEDRAQTMREQVLRLLDARLGAGNAVVEVAVETVTESEAIRERVVDPDSRVAISTDTEERTNSSNEAGGGDVTVASNLPDGEAGDGSSNSQNSETRERVNYEVSETEREIVRGPGAVKKISVAVLVNSTPAVAADEASAEALPEEELDSLRELVASAVGLDEARGDTLTLKSMPFTPLGTEGTVASATSPGLLAGLDVMTMIQLAVLALVSLVLGLFVVRPILTKDPVAALPSIESDMPIAAQEPSAMSDFEPALLGEIDDGNGGFAPLVPQSSEPHDLSFETSDPVERLRSLISERKEETVEVLRGWLDETGEKTS